MKKTNGVAQSITFQEAESLLVRLGFRAYTSPEGHRVFHHPPTEALIVLPGYGPGERLYSVHLADIRRTLAVYGIRTPDQIDALLTPTAV